VANLRMALKAAKRGVRTLLVEQVPIEERDFTGGEATGLWQAISEADSTTAVSSPEDVLSVAKTFLDPRRMARS